MEEDKNNKDEEEITIDLSKVKKFFKREKKKVSDEEKEVDEKIEEEEKKIEKLEEKKEGLEEKEEKVEETIGEEKEKVEGLKEKQEELKQVEEGIKESEEEVKEEIQDVKEAVEEGKEKIGELKEEKKEKEIQLKKAKKEKKEESEKEAGEKEEGIAFDLKKIKNIFTKKSKAGKEAKPSSEEISFDPKKAWKFIAEHKTLFLLLIPIFFSIYFRAYPIYLPITDDWARDTVYNNIQGGISSQISQQYPNLPDQQRNALVQKQFNEILKQQKNEIGQQIEATSNYFKSRMQDEDGQTYLLAIDPWLAYGYARNYIRNGHWGDRLLNETIEWYTLRNGRIGQRSGFRLLPFMMVINYHIMNILGEASVLTAAFYVPLILITLAAIAAFFIGKKFGGYTGALTASIIVGIHAALLNRTAAGFSDTDNVIAFFEMVTVMFFVLAFAEKNKRKQLAYTILAGLSMGFYTKGHQSWWHIFDFLLAALGVYFLYYAWTKRAELKKGITNFLKLEKTQNILKLFFGFVISTWVFGAIIRTLTGDEFMRALKRIITAPFLDPLAFISAKQVAVTTIWPNVLTTVAELNRSSVAAAIAQIGGKLLFVLSLIGILMLFLKKEKGERKYLFYGALLLFWYIGALYAAQSSVRFTAFLVPAFALAIAAFVGFAYSYVNKWMSKEVHITPWLSKTIVILLILFFIFAPLLRGADATAKREVPSMNDAWYESLIGIQNDTEDGVITSWWDFGHWFVAVAERRVTFDGGDQGERIHWAGKSLLTNDEDISIGILRMLNCGQEKAPHMLEKHLDGDTVKAIKVLNEIIVEDKEIAKMILESEGLSSEAVKEVLEVTHCDNLLDQYYIASDDMVGKAGVWGHFGSWNFTKASMYNKVHNKEREEGIRILTEEFGLDENKASDIYYEIRTNNADRWVSPWPGYLGSSGCSVKEEIVTCGNGLTVNLTNYDAKLTMRDGAAPPYSLVYADKQGIKEKRFDGNTAGASAALIPDGDGYRSVLMDPLHARGMFTLLFFFDGHGLECFDKFSYKKSFTGNEIYVYKVDWGCKTKNVMDEFKEKEVEKQEEPQTEENITISNSTKRYTKIV